MSQENLKNTKPEISGSNESQSAFIPGAKKPFIQPEVREYKSLKDVTLLTVPAVSGSTFFKTFK